MARESVRSAWVASASVVSSAALLACAGFWGFERPTVESDASVTDGGVEATSDAAPDGPCEETGCASGSACLFGRCGATCHDDRDCPTNARCLVRAPNDAHCAVGGACDDGGCPAGSSCAYDGYCRSSCGPTAQMPKCAGDQACVMSFCYGASADHDPTPRDFHGEWWLVTTPDGVYATRAACARPMKLTGTGTGVTISAAGSSAMITAANSNGSVDTYALTMGDIGRAPNSVPGTLAVFVDDATALFVRDAGACAVASIDIASPPGTSTSFPTLIAGAPPASARIVASSGAGALALAEDAACTDAGAAVRVYALDGGVGPRVAFGGASRAYAFGALPSGAGFLVQAVDARGMSSLHRVTWAGAASPIAAYSSLAADVADPAGGCAIVSYVGAGGAFYCRGTSGTHRLIADGSQAPARVDCPMPSARVSDVHAP